VRKKTLKVLTVFRKSVEDGLNPRLHFNSGVIKLEAVSGRASDRHPQHAIRHLLDESGTLSAKSVSLCHKKHFRGLNFGCMELCFGCNCATYSPSETEERKEGI